MADEIELTHECGLLCVDVQKDFFPGGALPAPDADEIIPRLNRYSQELFKMQGLPVFLTRDWHPEDHCSFEDQGGPWPPHCVRDTEGAEFHPDFRHPGAAPVISKGTEPDQEAYSGFDGTQLAKDLREMGVEKVFVGGVTTEYCVKETVIDAIDEGFEVYVCTDAIAPVDEQDGKEALQEMQEAGAELITAEDIA